MPWWTDGAPVQGSATGAYSPLRAATRPSFVLMDVDGTRVRRQTCMSCDRQGHKVWGVNLRRSLPPLLAQLVAYVYQLLDGEVKVDKVRSALRWTNGAISRDSLCAQIEYVKSSAA
jgi:hypothetical protein